MRHGSGVSRPVLVRPRPSFSGTTAETKSAPVASNSARSTSSQPGSAHTSLWIMAKCVNDLSFSIDAHKQLKEWVSRLDRRHMTRTPVPVSEGFQSAIAAPASMRLDAWGIASKISGLVISSPTGIQRCGSGFSTHWEQGSFVPSTGPCH
jgi:hypothetical protein